jgi:L-fucose/D-arabinose isomerase
MRSTPIGIAMLNDEREHVYSQNNEQNMAVVRKWADVIRNGVKNEDGDAPEVVVASKIITGVRVAQEVGEELVRKGCKSVIMCYNVWNFPFLCWPFINCFGSDMSHTFAVQQQRQVPGNVGCWLPTARLGRPDERRTG